MDTKICSKCKKDKPLSEFSTDKNMLRKRNRPSACCRDCLNLISREASLKSNYGISIDQYDELFNKQKGCCCICGRHQSEFKRRLAVDHNHKTGIIRGLVCNMCNMAIGYIEIYNDQLLNYLQK